MKLPKILKVRELVKGRYKAGTKPVNWEDRVGGIDEIISEDGDTVLLQSSGDQSSPDKGWELMLIKEVEGQNKYTWTLYGLS